MTVTSMEGHHPGEKTFEQLIRHRLQHLMLDHNNPSLTQVLDATGEVFRQLERKLESHLGAQEAETLLQQALLQIRQEQGIPNR